jgi:hypothetical protein
MQKECVLIYTYIRNGMLILLSQLIPYYAQYQASQPTMWGGRTPTADGVAQLSAAFVAEWNWAVGQMLRHWDQAPTR